MRKRQIRAKKRMSNNCPINTQLNIALSQPATHHCKRHVHKHGLRSIRWINDEYYKFRKKEARLRPSLTSYTPLK